MKRALLLIGVCVVEGCRTAHEPPAAIGTSARPVAIAPEPRFELEQPLTVQDSVRVALERNPDLRAGRARIDAARATIAAAEAALSPALAVDVSVLHGDAPSTYLFTHIDAHDLPPNVDFNDPGSFDATEAGLTLRWNLWNGGRDSLAIQSARLGEGRAASLLRAAENALIQAVIAAHLDAHAAGEVALGDQASIQALRSEVATMGARVGAGSALRSDLLSLEVRLSEAEQRLLSSTLARRLALAALRSLLALEPGEPLEIAADAPVDRALPASLEDARANALMQRAELEAARTALAQSEAMLESSRRAFLPRLDLVGRVWGVETDTSLDLGEANGTLALALHFDLFEGGARRAAISAARAARSELVELDRKTVLAIELEVETAWLQLEEARARTEVAARAVTAAQETLDEVGRQFRGGAVTVTRFLEVEAASTQARTARIRAELDLERAQVGLARAIGALGDGFERSGGR